MDTFGWDTVYVVNITKANAALAAHKEQLIISFDTSGIDGLPVSAKGQFSGWEIVEGGSGTILHLKLLISEGDLEINITQPKSVDLAGVSLVVAVQLKLLPGQISNTQELQFDIERVGQEGQTPEPGMIVPVALQAHGKLDLAEQGLLQAALLDYIVANAQQISFVFATINLVPPQTNSWLTPVRSAYAYANRIGGSGALAILSVTTNRDISQLPRQVDATALSLNYDATYVISSEMFLEHVMMPVLPSVFGNGTTPSSFALRDNTIVNTQTIRMDGIKEGAITYYPNLTSLAIKTNGSGLASDYRGDVDLKAGISMTFIVRPDNKVVYNPNTKTIGFQPDPNPSSSTSVDIPWYWWFLGPIARGIMEIIVRVIADGISNSLTKDVGDQITITKNPPLSIQWTETSALDVQNAGVEFAFFMQGSLPTTGN